MSPALSISKSHALGLPSESTGLASPCASQVGMATGCLNSTEILRGQKAVEINHNGATYRLQATRLGKLILTK